MRRRLRNLVVLGSLTSATVCSSQPFVRQVESIPVTAHGVAVSQPFAGGVNAPEQLFVDIDGDGDADLFLFDNDNVLDFYRNVGTPQSPEFKLCRGCIAMPPFLFWYRFADLNGDGALDLCTDDSSNGIRYYRNAGTIHEPDFALQTSRMLDSAGTPLNAGFSSIPDFVDIDGDGLIDVLSTNSLDGSVNFYKNIGSKTSPMYRFVTGAFQGIRIIGDSCFASTLRKATPHGAGVLRYVDIDANGTYDMFYGDVFARGMFFLNNAGSVTQAHFQCTTSEYPDASLSTDGYNQPSFVDIDGDGDFDLFVGVLNTFESHGFWFYKNTGTATAPSFQLQTRDYLSVVDVGANARPVFTDIDNNGTLDMFVGSLDGTLWYFRNTGTPSVPGFELVDTLYAGISGSFTYAPSFVDIDADGDQDLFIGRFDGKIKFYRNTGSALLPQFNPDSSPVDTISTGQGCVPAFVDYDGDGDMDLFVGKANGQISFYRDDGNAAQFLPVLVDPKFLNLDLGADAAPTFADVDRDGDFDMIAGNDNGRVFYFENTGSATVPQLVLRTDHFAGADPVRESAPAFADIDGDGDPDLFLGTSKGGMHFYRNNSVTGVEERAEVPRTSQLYQNYPNPFNPTTDFGFRIADFGLVQLTIHDILGRKIATIVREMKQPGEYTVSWDAGNLAGGIYFYKLTAGRFAEVKKLVILR